VSARDGVRVRVGVVARVGVGVGVRVGVVVRDRVGVRVRARARVRVRVRVSARCDLAEVELVGRPPPILAPDVLNLAVRGRDRPAQHHPQPVRALLRRARHLGARADGEREREPEGRERVEDVLDDRHVEHVRALPVQQVALAVPLALEARVGQVRVDPAAELGQPLRHRSWLGLGLGLGLGFGFGFGIGFAFEFGLARPRCSGRRRRAGGAAGCTAG